MDPEVLFRGFANQVFEGGGEPLSQPLDSLSILVVRGVNDFLGREAEADPAGAFLLRFGQAPGSANNDQRIVLQSQQGDGFEGGCRASEEIHKQASTTGILIAQHGDHAAAMHDVGDVGASSGLGNQGMTGGFAIAPKPLMQPRIVQVACDNTHGKAKFSKGVHTDFPVAEMATQADDRPAAAESTNAGVSIFEIEDLGAGFQFESTRQLHHFADHAEQMLPHRREDSQDFTVRQLFTKGNAQVVPRDVIPADFARQQVDDAPGQSA